jgi:hypothetical protein
MLLFSISLSYICTIHPRFMTACILSIYQQKILPDDWLREAYDKKWFKIFLPIACGGLQCSLQEGLRVLYETASRHGGLGWAVNLGAGAGFFARCLKEEVAIGLYSNPTAVIAGSGATTGTAVEYPEGYLLHGAWKYCSGAAHATAFTVTAVLPDERKHSFVLMPEQVQISDQWSGFGLKPASSFTITVSNAYVSEARRFDVDVQRSFTDYALYRLPFQTFAQFCMLATLSGIVRCYLTYVSEIDQALRHRVKDEFQQMERVHRQLCKKWESLSSGFENHDTPLIQQGVNFKKLFSEKIYHLFRLACAIYYRGGMCMADEAQPVHWAWRDVLTAGQHFLLR